MGDGLIDCSGVKERWEKSGTEGGRGERMGGEREWEGRGEGRERGRGDNWKDGRKGEKGKNVHIVNL